MPRFWDEVIVPYEGLVITNDPDDLGGHTCCGISRRYRPDWQGWALIDQGKTAEAIALAPEFYLTRWQYQRCHQISHEGLALKLFDHGVLFGVVRAAGWLQEAVGMFTPVVVDGIVGPQTIAAVARLRNVEAEAVQVLMAAEAVQRHITNDVGPRKKFLAGHLRRAGAIFHA